MARSVTPTIRAMLDLSREAFNDVQRVARALLDGKSNNTGTVTLTDSATTTTVTEMLCSATSVVVLMPQTATAATAIGAGAVYVTPGNGSFEITHDSTADTDRTFGWTVTG